MKNTGIPYELLIKSLVVEMLGAGQTIAVQHDVVVKGIKGSHQIDVLWRFDKAGITYTTLVQAKDWQSRVIQGAVLTFNEVLSDIPGQPRGVMISRVGFQRGAREYAKKCGIKLYRLHCPTSGTIKIIDFGYANMALDLANHQLCTTVFTPSPKLQFFTSDLKAAKRKLPKKLIPRDIHLADQNGASLGTIRDVLAEFVEQMRKQNVLKDSFVKSFDPPVSAKLGRLVVPLTGVSADIEIETATQSTPFGPWGLADFILEDLDTGKAQTFKRQPLAEATPRKRKRKS
jgi:hypothetical protein